MTATVETLPVNRRRWTWPNWPAELCEDADGFHFDGDELNRNKFDECAHAVDSFDCPGLLSVLVDDGSLDLGRPDMAGVVAAVWASSEYAESALTRARWVELFRANGFDNRPAEPIQLFRGCTPGFQHFDAAGHLVGLDAYGQPADPYNEIVESRDVRCGMSWTTSLRAARNFARAHLGGEVFAATVEPEFVLAVLGSDYVVDPAGLAVVAPIGVGIAAVTR
ncbi:hypothetical protein AWB90_18315 [Mycobacterium paraense]|uniref:Uncharacterized protein n=1 Tax=Mycobacterium paraense TaxID=767916 RepID=A0A1X2A792_9MYCO|nr:hypothetical protein [Mycobacterium paraense]ORW43108.1 hypothetical protein AWB90_18315 [Mycobacterium paraense]